MSFNISIMKRVLIILLITAIAPAVTYFSLVRGTQTTYTANVKILFTKSQILSEDSIAKITQLLPTYEQVITSFSIAQKASELSGISPEEIQSSLSAEQLGEQTQWSQTQVLSLGAKNSDSQKAIDIVTTTAQAFIDYLAKQQNDNNIKAEDRLTATVIEPANQAAADTPNTKRTLLLAAAVGFIISTGGIFVFRDSQRA